MYHSVTNNIISIRRMINKVIQREGRETHEKGEGSTKRAIRRCLESFPGSIKGGFSSSLTSVIVISEALMGIDEKEEKGNTLIELGGYNYKVKEK